MYASLIIIILLIHLTMQAYDHVSCAVALGLVCVMTGLQLPRNHIIIFGDLNRNGTICNDDGPDVTLLYLQGVHGAGYKILAIAANAYERAKEQEGNLLDGRKWKGMRIEKVATFWELLKLCFATSR